MRNFHRLTPGALVGGMLAIASPAQATTTFAQFLQAVPSARIFTYTNVTSVGTKAKLGTLASSNTVLVSDLGSLASPTAARINLVGTASALPTVGTDITQLFSGSITFTLLAPQLGLYGWSTDALRVTFVDAELIAPPGGTAPGLQSRATSVITYQSDFVDLSSLTSEDFSLSFSGASAALSMSGLRLPNFKVSGSGTFAGVAPAPEPASWALMLGGFGLVGAAMRSARRRSAVSFG